MSVLSDIASKVSVFNKFLNLLTWVKLMQLTVFVAIIASAWAAYDNRQSIYNYVSHTRIRTHGTIAKALSPDSVGAIDSVVAKSSLITGVYITIIDFQKNRRSIIYTSIDNSDLKLSYEKSVDTSIPVMPLFNNDVINNKILISLINGEFICYPYSDSTSAKSMPLTIPHAHTVCDNSIPPYYGRFSGVVSIITDRQPTSEEIDQIRALSKSLAAEIYDRDFN